MSIAAPSGSFDTMQDFYRRHSAQTDPGRYHDWLVSCPAERRELVECIGRLVLNFVTDRTLVEPPLFAERLPMVDLRTTHAMLDALHRIADRPLSERRSPEQRIIGNCRDVALLACALHRARGIASRVRFGFAHRCYQPDQPQHEHALTEILDAASWRPLDCRANSDTVERWRVPLIPGEFLPEGYFRPATAVWRDCRQGHCSFAQFSNAGDARHGMWYVSKLMYLDLAALNGFEPLVWDVWGPQIFRQMSLPPDDPDELRLLDMFADFNLRDPEQWHAMRMLYESDNPVRAAGAILSYSPCRGLQRYAGPARQSAVETGRSRVPMSERVQ
jgi:hypothetical protein